jgi:Fic family protein
MGGQRYLELSPALVKIHCNILTNPLPYFAMRNFEAGRWVDRGGYRSFEPSPIHRPWVVDDMEVLDLLSKADRHLGRLDMYSEHVPIDLFISMHVAKEAAQSSRIEGTQTRVEDLMLAREDIPSEERDDWEEVQNYIEAMDHAVARLDELPFSSRLIRDTHRVLMQGVRGQQRQPGEFRTTQNWIGGASPEDAIFIPPVHTSVPGLMADLEAFVHDGENRMPDLLKIALVHYQFETIHPFVDGNGRVGRLIITLYLVGKEILRRPILYLSDFLERNRTHYYDNLTRVREKDDLSQWFKFFLVGIIETAKSGIDTFTAIMQLQQDAEARIQTLGSRAGNAAKVLRHLYQRPIMDAKAVQQVTGLSAPASYDLIRDLERLGILHEFTGARRGRRYLFAEYIDLYEPRRD